MNEEKITKEISEERIVLDDECTKTIRKIIELGRNGERFREKFIAWINSEDIKERINKELETSIKRFRRLEKIINGCNKMMLSYDIQVNGFDISTCKKIDYDFFKLLLEEVKERKSEELKYRKWLRENLPEAKEKKTEDMKTWLKNQRNI